MLAGVLVDVSGSMKSSLQLHMKPSDQDITRAQSIFTTIMNIVNREVCFQDSYEVFVLAFGLLDVATCDLLTLLDYVQTLDLQRNGNGHENLLLLLTFIKFLNAYQYIREHVTESEAQFLFKFYSENREKLRQILEQVFFSTADRKLYGNGQKALIDLLKSNRASIAEEYVREHMTEEEAGLLYKFYSKKPDILLEFVEEFGFSASDRSHHGSGQEAIIELLSLNGAPNVKKYVRKYMSEEQAQFLFKFYSRRTKDLDKVVKDLPDICKRTYSLTNMGLFMMNMGSTFKVCDDANTVEEKATTEKVMRAIERAYDPATKHLAILVKEHVDLLIIDLKHLLRQPIVEKLRTMTRPESRTFNSTVNLLKQVTNTSSDSSKTQQSLTSAQLSALADSIEPFIYGNTPMCQALQSALHTFCSGTHKQKVLFLLSDGESTDGNPTRFAQELRKLNVLVFACILTSKNISNPRQLYYEPDPNWSKAHREMFELSTTVENSHSAMSILQEQKWDLPPAGHSRLFVQANHPDVIKEFSNIIQYMSESNDVLMNMIGRVSLDIYINAANSTFEAKEQTDLTCYAYASATVFHLAMCRIEGREDGVDKFEDIYEELINKFGCERALTEEVLRTCAPTYRLHSKEVEELGARQAINQRRPVVATFRLNQKQWDAFTTFYADAPQGVLEAKDLGLASVGDKLFGHAVVLMKCDPTSLTFINSWGTKFADKGFFRVRNQSVLNLKFYDVYWDLNDLTAKEIEAFERKSSEKGQNLIQKLPIGIKNLPYKCPECGASSPVWMFIIDFSGAKCPECDGHFKPTPMGVNVTAYTR
ncbi:unnamed protein product [Rotaria socialis]|uniref:VWFA domain-containing protein n=1 Tax=Rotaria socialis TaxID=392032 RepID=A0A820YZR8_9BILA|nr:unnamed protein product [Rotaria socialis]CAF4556305.1 unnamed protein product [Rotaria socialis]